MPQLQSLDTASLKQMAAEEKMVSRRNVSKKNTRADSLDQDSRNYTGAQTSRESKILGLNKALD